MNTAGFSIRDEVLSPHDCDEVLRALRGTTSGRAGARHLMSHPAVVELASRRELLDIARAWVGPGAIPYRCTLFEKSGARNWLVVWHQDTTLPLAERFDRPDWGPWLTKENILYAHAPTWALEQIVALRVHLDASTSSNGPLKVIPGSHRKGVLSDEQVFEVARRTACVETLAGKGGILAMSPLLIHASSKVRGAEPRRVLHLEYGAAMDLGSGVRLAKA